MSVNFININALNYNNDNESCKSINSVMLFNSNNNKNSMCDNIVQKYYNEKKSNLQDLLATRNFMLDKTNNFKATCDYLFENIINEKWLKDNNEYINSLNCEQK